jgi:hypothetical protein
MIVRGPVMRLAAAGVDGENLRWDGMARPGDLPNEPFCSTFVKTLVLHNRRNRPGTRALIVSLYCDKAYVDGA